MQKCGLPIIKVYARWYKQPCWVKCGPLMVSNEAGRPLSVSLFLKQAAGHKHNARPDAEPRGRMGHPPEFLLHWLPSTSTPKHTPTHTASMPHCQQRLQPALRLCATCKVVWEGGLKTITKSEVWLLTEMTTSLNDDIIAENCDMAEGNK